MELALLLVSGNAEIIGRIDHVTSEYIILEEPLVLRPVQQSPNQYVLQFFQHSMANPTGKHRFYFNSMISQSEEIPAELEKQYIKETSSIILNNALDAFAKL